jgi:L-lactate utilization protein LutB
MQKEKTWLTQFKNSINWFNKNRVERTLEALNKNGFNSIYASTKAEALKKILELIPKGQKIGVAGSMTIRDIGLVDALNERGEQLDDIWSKKHSPEEELAIRKRHFSTDVFLTSSNAITEDGKLINIDGLGNRVAAMIFGPKKVIVVAGTNKIVKDVHEGINRIRNVAAPMNVMRFEGKTPCTQTGNCNLEECKPPDRHCHVISIMEKRPMKTDTTIVIIGEKLGF